MTSARTVLVFGLYLLLVGLGLALAPDSVLELLRLPPTQDFWPRVVGVLALVLACYYLVAARANLLPLIRASVFMRFAAFGLFGTLVILKLAPRELNLVGLVDFAGALWTAFALKRERATE